MIEILATVINRKLYLSRQKSDDATTDIQFTLYKRLSNVVSKKKSYFWNTVRVGDNTDNIIQG